jgi:dephospho-CoA kinase
MNLKMIGLTGSIGMGKSTVGKMFEANGIPIYNADAEVHKLYDVGGAAVDPIRAAFPDAVIDGRVNRPTLSKLVMDNDAAIKQLERIVHPLVGVDRAAFMQKVTEAGHKMVILDIPLVYETGGDRNLDKVLVVSAPLDVQKERVLARDDMTEEKFLNILSRQTPDAEKRERADHVINTHCSEVETLKQVVALIKVLEEEFKDD